MLQGFGNASYHCARLLHADGFRIIGLSDSRSAIYDPDGIDPIEAMKHKRANRGLAGCPSNGKLQEITNEELLESECDVLIPAALENQIVLENAPNIKARVILELANGPTSPAADRVLNENGKIVVPDILANSGGVTVSYFEWVQNKAGYYWPLSEVQSKLKSIIEPEARKIWEISQERGLPMRTAAYVHGLGRIASALEARGTKAYFDS